MSKYVWVVVTLTSLLMVGANAESLKAKKARAEAMESAKKDRLDHSNKICGTDIKMEIDWKSFEGNFGSNTGESSATAYCSSVFEGIQSICETMGDDGKASVKKSIKTVKCSYKKGVKTDEFAKNLNLKGGTLTASYDWDTGNIGDGAKEFLGSKLE